MIFVFLLLDEVVGIPRSQLSSDNYIREIQNMGQILKRYTSSCPYSNANRCDIKEGTLFSRSRCEWLNFYEECSMDGSEECYGYFDSRDDLWLENVKWKSCNDSVIKEITNLFPGVTLDFENVKTGRGRSCLPTVWSGPETCDPVLEKG